MFSRVVSLLLLLSLPTESYALRQAGVESEPTRQALSGALTAGAEEVPADAVLNLMSRIALTHDFAQITELSDRNPVPGLRWDGKLVHAYGQTDRIVIAQDQDRYYSERDLRLAGFLVFEVRGGGDGISPEPESLEILRWVIDPGYQATERVARDLLEGVQGRYPGRRVRVVTDQLDAGLRFLLGNLGFRPRRFKAGEMELALRGFPGKTLAENLSMEVHGILLQLGGGRLDAQEAALELMKVLDRAAEWGIPFSNWLEAYLVIDRVQEEVDLGGAVALRIFIGDAARGLRDGRDPLVVLRQQIELFRAGYVQQTPFQYLEKIWAEDRRVAGLRKKMEEGNLSPRNAAGELLEVLEGLQSSGSLFTNWGDAYRVLLFARRNWMENGSSPKLPRDLGWILRQLWRYRVAAAQRRDSREELFAFLALYQRVHKGWTPSRVLQRDWPEEKEVEPQAGMEEAQWPWVGVPSVVSSEFERQIRVLSEVDGSV